MNQHSGSDGTLGSEERARPSPRRRKRAWKRGQGGVRKAGGAWYIRYQLNKRRIQERTDAKNESEARTILNERLGTMAKGAIPAGASRTRLRELYEDMKADYENKGQDLQILEKRWRHVEPVFGTDLIATITSGRMQAYVTARREEGAAKATVQHEIAAIRRMFRLGFRARKVAFVPAVPEIEVDNARKVTFTDEEFRGFHERLVEATAGTPNEWLPLFATLKYWLPTRTEDLLSREWARHVDIDAGRIEFDPVKRGRARKPFLPNEALAALRAWHDKTRRFEREYGVIVRHVFHRDGEAVRSFPYDVWHEACRAAGINERRIPHDLRRTATRNYRRSGVDKGTVMAIAGWRTRAMFDRYDIKDDDDLKDAAERIAAAKWPTVGKKRRVVALKKAT